MDLSEIYRETGCSFARDFAMLSRNVGGLIGSLLRASCNLKFQLAASWSQRYAQGWRKVSEMYQVLIQYFEDRYASFYVQNPISLEQVKKAVAVPRGIPNDQIRISYKDVQLGTFVNIDSHEQLHLQETFPKRISLRFWFIQAGASESQGKWLAISSEKLSKLSATTTNRANGTSRREIRTEDTFHTIGRLWWIRASKHLPLSAGRIQRKNSWFGSYKVSATRN